MATYNITDFEIKLVESEADGVKYRFLGIKILDSWADSLPTGSHEFRLSVEKSSAIFDFLLKYPVLYSIGGSKSYFDSSDFSRVTYPVNTQLLDSRLQVTCVNSSTMVNIALYYYYNNNIRLSYSTIGYSYQITPAIILYNNNQRVLTDINAPRLIFSYDSDNIFDVLNPVAGLGFGAPKSEYRRNQQEQIFYATINNLNIDISDIGFEEIVISDDPYSPGGEADTGGGEGTFDDTSVPVPIPALPDLGAVDTGFITLFNPTLQELLALANYMWSSFDLDTFRKLFADPMDCILGLSIVPVAVPDGGQSAVKVGNISTGVNMNKAAAQYVSVDCGSITVEEYWGAYLDYDPYTRAELYLPYIGIHPVSMDDIMGKSVHVAYHVDILSGACCAYVECDGTVLYSFLGQCSSSVPVSGNDFTSVINGVLGVAGSIGSMVQTGGANAPTQIPKIASNAINALKPTVEKSGSLSGTGGMMGIQVPYLILTRPRQAVAAGQNALEGYPSFISRSLGELTGYTEVESVHLEGIPCTGAELEEIENLLKGGVIL